MKNIRFRIRNKAGHLVTGPGDYVMLKTLTERILNATVTKLFKEPDEQIHRIMHRISMSSMGIIKVKNEI
jgi:phosphoenolpyruvate carboxylase